ncbi:MAG: hypothetical protein HKN77_08950 [Woeseiaceae bacterium]|nr:hypothetical protein [Woeseiaceae bacterium]
MAIVACSLLMAPAFSGDDDKASAYKIYIDPDTGRYTTQDPHATAVPDPAAMSPVTRQRDDSLWRLVMAAASILVISFAVISIMRRRQTAARLR